jgi:hypothetical protein
VRGAQHGAIPSGKPPSGKNRGLPVARSLEDSSKSHKPIPAKPIVQPEPLAPVETVGQFPAPASRPPQWIWWAAAAGAVAIIALIVTVLLWRLS